MRKHRPFAFRFSLSAFRSLRFPFLLSAFCLLLPGGMASPVPSRMVRRHGRSYQVYRTPSDPE